MGARLSPGGTTSGSAYFERVRQSDQSWFAPGRPHEGEADRKTADKPGGHRDGWVPGYRRRAGRAPAVVVAEHVIGEPGRMPGQRDDGIEVEIGERRVQPIPRDPAGGRARLPVVVVAQVAAGRFRLLEQFLTEVTEHFGGVPVVELDQASQVRRMIAAEPG